MDSDLYHASFWWITVAFYYDWSYWNKALQKFSKILVKQMKPAIYLIVQEEKVAKSGGCQSGMWKKTTKKQTKTIMVKIYKWPSENEQQSKSTRLQKKKLKMLKGIVSCVNFIAKCLSHLDLVWSDYNPMCYFLFGAHPRADLFFLFIYPQPLPNTAFPGC